jgi:P27 family predicted phage terminase small subunit
MGLRGYATAPTALKILRGNPGKRALPKNEPMPAAVPQNIGETPPEHMPEAHRKWWVYYSDILRDMKVLTVADLVALENLAGATADRIAQEADLAKTGPLYKTTWGAVQISPLFNVVDRLKERELKLLREFGLTPSSKTKVQTVGGERKSANPWDDL